LKRESRREARAAKEEAEAQGAQQKAAIKAAVRGAWEEGFPTDVEEKEAYFMNEVSRGEALCQDGEFCSSPFRLSRFSNLRLS
jgi:import receptor subunit TOM20